MEPKLPPFHRIVAYLRKSRADGEESVETVLSKHERMIQDYCLRTYNAELPADRIYREVQSGETIASRPVMQYVIRMIQDKEIDAVLCVDLQRLSRGDLSDVGELSKLFRYTGCLIITPVRTYNVADEYDRKFFEMEIMHGNEYLEYAKKIMGRGRKQSVLEGNYIGSVAPYGYTKVWADKKPTLAINEEEAKIVRLIYDLYISEAKMGPTRIAEHLNKIGTKPRKGDRWTAQIVRNIVENTVNIGKVTWDRRKVQKTYENGTISNTRPWSDDGIIVDGKHPAIISQEIWDKAQEVAQTRAHPAANARNTGVNPLAGLLYCRCGYVMSYKLFYDRKTKQPLSPYYICDHTTVNGCDVRSASVESVLALIRDSMAVSLERYRSQLDETAVPDTSQTIRESLESELAALKKQQNRLFDLLEREVYDEDTFRERSAVIKERTAEITAELAKIQSTVHTAADYSAFVTNLEICVNSICDTTIPAETRNDMMKKVVRRITYSRDRSPRRAWDPTPIEIKIIYRL